MQYQKDTARMIYSWKLNKDKSNIIGLNIDTLLTGFQNYNPLYRNNISNSYLGNYGSAGISHNFKQSIAPVDFIFVRGYTDYLHKAEDIGYFHAKRPFTNVKYSGGGTDDVNGQNLNLIHTQNVNRYFNVGMKYNLISSTGHYQRQSVKNSSFTMFSSYRKEKYLLYSAFSLNKFKIEENGGLASDEDISSQYSPSTLDVKLQEAQSLISNRSFSVVQEFLLGSKLIHEKADTLNREISLSDTIISNKPQTDTSFYTPYNTSEKPRFVHNLNYETSYRTFFDKYPQSGFYKEIFIDSITTKDSARYNNLYNSFQLVKDKNLLKNRNIGGKILLGTQFLHQYYYLKDTSFWNNHISISIYDKISKKLNWNINYDYYYQGYRSGDYKINADIVKSLSDIRDEVIIGARGKFSNKTAAYFQSEYQSKYFVWENDFSKTKSLDLELFFENKKRNLSTNLSWINLNDYIYFDTLAFPTQFNGNINVLSISINKNFHFGKWDIINKVDFQYSDNKDVVRIPVFSGYFSIQYKKDLFKGALKTQIGAQIHYNTAYYGFAYMPATGQFYNQDIKKLGNYPYMDIYLNLKVARTCFFLIYEHFNSWFMEDNYFEVLHYPMKSAFFKFGLSWSFYN
ncbi:putative porin [Bacteroidota bacterium]